MEKYVNNYYELRLKLVANQTIKGNIFMIDYEFTSPSATATVILGVSSNGKTAWKTQDGTILKEL